MNAHGPCGALGNHTGGSASTRINSSILGLFGVAVYLVDDEAAA